MNIEQNFEPNFEPDFETILADNEPITKHSARILRKQILQDGHVSKREREFLRDALDHGNLMDDESFYILLDVLLNGKRIN
ncbi:MAG: hypothetical protein K2X77_25885 [Candidatus Obscuribacterales bacterium]|jgi:hypothetical protein|nr:hypothetical protein [Candidatus Obscuribacterales bacterium]